MVKRDRYELSSYHLSSLIMLSVVLAKNDRYIITFTWSNYAALVKNDRYELSSYHVT